MSSILATLALCNALLAADREISLRRTFWAVALIESGGDPRAVNRSEGAVGLIQIRPIMLFDANRIIGYNKYTLADRLSPEKSFQIFKSAVRYYFPRGTPEQWARCWNGGPDGPRQSCTLRYWTKVEKALARIR